MTYVPNLIKIGSDMWKLIGGIYRHTDNMVLHKTTPIFFQNKEGKLVKTKMNPIYTLVCDC
jgi:hypothetical protein